MAAEQAPPGKNHKVATKLPTRLCETKRNNYKDERRKQIDINYNESVAKHLATT